VHKKIVAGKMAIIKLYAREYALFMSELLEISVIKKSITVYRGSGRKPGIMINFVHSIIYW